MHQAECLPERPSSTPERLQLNGAEEKRHQVGVFDLNELVEFLAHVRDIEDLSESEVLGDRVHYVVYGFVFFHKRLFGKNLGEFPRAASFLVPERRPRPATPIRRPSLCPPCGGQSVVKSEDDFGRCTIDHERRREGSALLAVAKAQPAAKEIHDRPTGDMLMPIGCVWP